MTREVIKEGIEDIKAGLLKLQGAVFPYGPLGRLTGVLQTLVDELQSAWLHEYASNTFTKEQRLAQLEVVLQVYREHLDSYHKSQQDFCTPSWTDYQIELETLKGML